MKSAYIFALMPAPLIGGQNWYDNVCKVEKI